MIPATKGDVDIVSTMSGENVEMTIDEQSLQHIMFILRNMYSDNEEAVIRELCTNAHDSHIEAGQSRPIEVTTPTAFSRYFKVQDFGVGMDVDDVKRIYSRYGASTKRESNEVTGYLGIGSKAPLAYTNQFTVRAVKNAQVILVTVGLDEESVGTMTITGPYDTDEPNGVEISIPVKRDEDFLNKCLGLFKYWPPGSVLLNGEDPPRLDNVIEITPDVWLRPASRRAWDGRENVLVMGVVPYPIDTGKINLGVRYTWDVIAHVPLGTVNLAPDRESLAYTTRTMKVLREIAEKLDVNLAPALQNEVSAQPNAWTAAGKAVQLAQAMYEPNRPEPTRGFHYQGIPIPEFIHPPAGDPAFIVSHGGQRRSWSYSVNGGRLIDVGKSERWHRVFMLDALDSVWVGNFTKSVFNHVVKKKLWKWCEDNERPFPRYFIVCRGRVPRVPWINPENVVDWSVIDAIKLPAKKGHGTGTKLSYDVVIDGGNTQYNFLASDIDKTHPIYYVVGDAHDARYHASRILKLEDHFTLVFFSSRREEKFLRLFPTAKRAGAYYNDMWHVWWESLSKTERDLLQLERIGALRELTNLPQTGLDDPNLRRLARLARQRIQPEVLKQLDIIGSHHVPTTKNPLARYPLVMDPRDSWNTQEDIRQHNRLYVNAVYNEGDREVA